MINISKPLTAGQTGTYYKQEYSVASNNYLSQGQALAGQAHGALAATFGLSGDVSPEQFARVMEGQHAQNGEQLIKHKDTIRTRSGEELGHRAAWDVTINASKTVSLTALVGGDEGIRQAHIRAERTAIEWGSQFIQARTGAHSAPETTAKALWISFEHTTARPVNGYAAPQLHGHNLLANLTLDSEGKWRSLQTSELFRVQQGMRAVYHSEVGHYLVGRGFEVERGKGHSIEIKGYTPEYVESQSPRSRQIKEAVEEWERKTGRTANREIRQQISRDIRETKSALAPELQAAEWQAQARQHGNQHERVLESAAQREALLVTPERMEAKTREAVSHAIASLSEREAVFEHWKLVRTAVDHNLTTDVRHVEAEIARRQATQELIPVEHVRPNAPLHRFTTPEMIGIEREVIERVLHSQNQPHVTVPIQEAHVQRYPKLNADQQEVLRKALLSHDQIFGIQGEPGVGKSFPLGSIKELAEEYGYKVRGLGPNSQAAKGLRQAGINAETLQKHLTRQQAGEAPDAERAVLYFLDESSLASARQMRDFLRTLKPQDRALLVGDVGQHQSVEAGRIFAELQEGGMRVVRLEKILRQQEPGLLKALEAVSAGRIQEGVKLLTEQGRIHEIPNRHERLQTMARDFAAAPGQAQQFAPDNQSRQDLNAATRAVLRTTTKLHGADHQQGVLLPRQDLTGADRSRAAAYHEGDTIWYRKGSKALGIEPKSYARVIAVDGEKNELTVRRTNGTYQTYDPTQLSGVSVYQSAERSFAVGDRIQFLQKWDRESVSTRDLATITALDRYGNVEARLDDSGRKVRWNFNENRHVDHAYAMTSHSAQGVTVDRSFIHIDTSDNQTRLDATFFKTALSRARWDGHIYTDNAARLVATLSRTNDNTQALSPAQVEQYRQSAETKHKPVQHEPERERSYSIAL